MQAVHTFEGARKYSKARKFRKFYGRAMHCCQFVAKYNEGHISLYHKGLPTFLG